MYKRAKISILAMSMLIIMATSGMSPALGEISKAFPNAGSLISLIVTMPALTTLVLTLLTGKFVRLISKRKLVLIAMVIYTVSGVATSFFNNIYMILVMRAMLGVGNGIILPLSSDLIVEFFEGNERVSMVGMQNAFYNIGAILATLICGYLTVISWHYSSLIYSIGLIAFIITLLLLPKPPKVQQISTEKVVIYKQIYGLGFLMMLMFVGAFTMFTTLPLLIQSKNLGNAASVGIVVTTVTIGQFIVGLTFGKLFAIFKKFISIIALAFTSISFIILNIATGLNVVMLAAFLGGIGTGLLMPILVNLTIATAIATKSAVTESISVVFAFMLVGQFVSPYAYVMLGKLLNNTTPEFPFFITAIGFLIALVVAVIMTLRPSKAANVKENF